MPDFPEESVVDFLLKHKVGFGSPEIVGRNRILCDGARKE
jgi:hypothetical protein